MQVWLCGLALLAGLTAAADSDVTELPHSTVVDTDGDVIVRWRPDDVTNTIVMRVEARTRGWAAIGFSPSGGMAGADIILAWVADGRTHIQDMHAVGNGAPLLDDSDDVELLEGAENDTHTTFTFRRPLRPCDTQHDMAIGGDTTRLIWALHPADPVPGRGPAYHGTRRGVRSVSLDGSGVFQYPAEGQTESFFIGNSDTEVLSQRTHYHCSVHKLPDFGGQKVHYTGYRVRLSPATAAYVHHMLLYACSVPPGLQEYFDDYAQNHPGAKCYSKNMPPTWSFCKSVTIAWGVGSEGDMLPDTIGIPLGAEHGGATYYLLESHYDNVQSLSGLRDSSGVEMFYTRTLRPVEGGVFSAGHMVASTQLIPPALSRFTTGSVCSEQCTQKYLPAEGVQVHSVVLHAHLAGRAIRVRHLRAGRELPPILTDAHYDFNYQQARVVESNVRILPGDELLVECDYSTRDRVNVTMGGFGTMNEMCLAFLTYYPRTPLSGCGSKPHLGDFLQTMGVNQVSIKDNMFPPVKGVEAWTDAGFKYWAAKMSALVEGVPEAGAANKTTQASRDDWFNRAELSTLSVSVEGERPQTTLYDYLMAMSWDQATVESLQRLENGGRLYHRCEARGRNEITDFMNVFSGPHEFPEFEPRTPEKPRCTKSMTGTAGRRSQLSGATVALAVTVLRLMV